MRKTCPNGGFLFSLTKTKNYIENNYEVFLGVQTIVDPGGGCFQSIGAQRLYETVMGITY
jgi:hypothetical protein